MVDAVTNEEDAGVPLVNIEDIEGVRQLYLLVGVSLDLRFATECFERFRAISVESEQSGEFDQNAAFAYISAAVIAYNRCFSTGVRGGLSTDDLDLVPQSKPGAAREVHKMITNLRDKHIAHSVSPFEIVMVGGAIPDPASGECGVGVLRGFGLPFGAGQVEVFRNLTQALDNIVSSRAEQLQQDINAKMIEHGLEDLARRPAMEYRVPGWDEAGQARDFGRGQGPNNSGD